MIRGDFELHDLDVHEWTSEEGSAHLRETFDRTCRAFPEVMEPYATRISDVGVDDMKGFIRRALAETVRDRYPPAAQPANTEPAQ